MSNRYTVIPSSDGYTVIDTATDEARSISGTEEDANAMCDNLNQREDWDEQPEQGPDDEDDENEEQDDGEQDDGDEALVESQPVSDDEPLEKNPPVDEDEPAPEPAEQDENQDVRMSP